MKAFAKVALAAFGMAAASVSLVTTSSAQIVRCENMPADPGVFDPDQRGCDNPRGTDPRFNSRVADISSNDNVEALEAAARDAEPQA